jgi:hypothetical protein
MPRTTATADETVTVRLPKGTRDRVVALTGQPFSRLVRHIVHEVIKREEAKLAAAGGVKPLDAAHQRAAEAVHSS